MFLMGRTLVSVQATVVAVKEAQAALWARARAAQSGKPARSSSEWLRNAALCPASVRLPELRRCTRLPSFPQASSLDMQLEELRASREALQRQRSLADERLRRIDDAKMRRLRVGRLCLGGAARV